jgi:SAM-dependent methyltransferase
MINKIIRKATASLKGRLLKVRGAPRSKPRDSTLVQQRDVARKQRDEARDQRQILKERIRIALDALGYQSLKKNIMAFDANYTYEPREKRVEKHIKIALKQLNKKKKIKILEIGAENNSREYAFKDFDYTYHAIDIEKTAENVIVANIEDCPQIKDNTYDLIISIDVLEHVSRPWLAGEEIHRILKEGGVTYHTTLFSWRYHKDPEDYWRYSPAALDVIFSKLEKNSSHFDTAERRRSIIGKGHNRITPDIFGGWRENWRVHGIYKKK